MKRCGLNLAAEGQTGNKEERRPDRKLIGRGAMSLIPYTPEEQLLTLNTPANAHQSSAIDSQRSPFSVVFSSFGGN